METVQTHYPKLVELLEILRSDSGQIFLDSIESSLKPLLHGQLELLAIGEEQEMTEAFAQLPHTHAKALNAILTAAFDGV